MKVSEILQVKGADVFAISTTSSISDAVDILGQQNIGAVVVKNESDKLAGILSERDIVRFIHQKGVEAVAAPVSSCMTPDPFCCSLNTTVDELMAEMTTKRIRHMPVIEGGKLAGMISIGDVVKRKIEETEKEAAALKEYIAS